MATNQNSARTVSSGGNRAGKGNKRGNKTTKSKKGTSQKKGRKKQSVEYSIWDDPVAREVILIVITCVCLLLFLCNFGLIGPFGNAISSVMFGIFGIEAYIAPLCIAFLVFFKTSNRGNDIALVKEISGVVLFFLIGMIAEMASGAMNQMSRYRLKTIYDYSSQKHGGGVFSGSFAYFLCHYLSKVGCGFLIAALVFICIVCITEKSLLKTLKNGGLFAYEKTVDSASKMAALVEEQKERSMERSRRRMEEVEMQEQERILRMDRKVNGVKIQTLNEEPSVKRQPKDGITDDIHQIMIHQANDEKTRKERHVSKKQVTEIVNDQCSIYDFDSLVIKSYGKSQTKSDEELEHEAENAYHEQDDVFLPKAYREGVLLQEEQPGDFFGAVSPAFEKPYEGIEEMKGNPTQNQELVEDFLTEKKESFPARTADMYPDRSGEYQNFASKEDAFYEEESVLGQEETSQEEDGLAYEAKALCSTDGNEEYVRMAPVRNQGIFADAQNGSLEEVEIAKVESYPGENTFPKESILQQDSFVEEPSSGKENGFREGNVFAKENASNNRSTTAERNSSIKQASASFDRVRPQAALAPKEKMDATITTQTAKEILNNQKPSAPVEYKRPPITLLTPNKNVRSGDSERQLKETAMRLQTTLANFGVRVTITDISQGPTVTRYEFQPEQGVKVSKIVGLTDDIKLNLAATDIRMEAPIPGKAAIGIEIPNNEVVSVSFRELIDTREFRDFKSNLCFAVGKDIGGSVIISDISKMPHLLIAGATGSGKSVCINTIIMSLLYKAHPDDVKMIMIDPKVVELSVYNGIPHLLIPVVTEPKKAAGALQWGVAEMTDRYKKFADFNVRDLKGYNAKVMQMQRNGEQDVPAKMPQIVIIVDELADLMMVAPGEVEEAICRLAQLARAAGIHLIIATQRPSVDVITGLIKANMPSRIAFAVSSGVDSRTILDMVGAEKLLGKGDMLFYPQGYAKPARLQGAFISDDEVSNVVDYLKNQVIGNVYNDDIQQKIQNMKNSSDGSGSSSDGSSVDDYFIEAGRFMIDKDKASIGMLQRVFKIGFNRAARIMDQLCEAGVVGPEEGTKPRKILMSGEEFEQYVEEYI